VPSAQEAPHDHIHRSNWGTAVKAGSSHLGTYVILPAWGSSQQPRFWRVLPHCYPGPEFGCRALLAVELGP